MKSSAMNRLIQIGDIQVDESRLVELCRRYAVRELSVFGSASRGEMRPDSDINLLVEFLPDADIDLVSKKGLKPMIRTSVLEEAQLLVHAA